jgi:hypothetical protein
MSKKIEISIQPDGEVDIDLSGFHGKGCQKVLDDFADGATPKHVVTKREFHESASEKERVKQ